MSPHLLQRRPARWGWPPRAGSAGGPDWAAPPRELLDGRGHGVHEHIKPKLLEMAACAAKRFAASHHEPCGRQVVSLPRYRRRQVCLFLAKLEVEFKKYVHALHTTGGPTTHPFGAFDMHA